MSHFTTIKTQIKDLDALRAATTELSIELIPNAEARGYAVKKMWGEYVLRLKGPYDIALHRQGNGAYALTTDWWDGHVEREVGAEYGRLLQLYGVHKAIREARRAGYLVQRHSQHDGSIKVTLLAA